jgi:hypothetical protein
MIHSVWPSRFSFWMSFAFSFTAASTKAIISMSGLCSRAQPSFFSVQKLVLSDRYFPTIQRSSGLSGTSVHLFGVWIVKPRRSSL